MKAASNFVTLRDHSLRAFLAGTCTRFRRPADRQYADLEPGDKLWLREPYYLPAELDHLAPTQVAMRGVKPVFAAELAGSLASGLGKRRHARVLLREWHRFHAVVKRVDRERIQEITDAEAKAEGYASRDLWLKEYDHSIATFDGSRSKRVSSFNPTVLVITLELIRAPLKLPERTSNRWKEPA